MKTTYIYALIDPRNNHVRYIGKANDPYDRYINHFNSARDKNTHKRSWINSVRNDGFRPELLILDKVPLDKWQWWETFYISLYQTYGFKLVNYTNGGDGSTFGNKGSWKKGNIPHNKGIPCKEETKQKIKDKLIGTSNISSYKPVIQYDLQYNEIKRYKCVKDAVDESKGLFIRSKISACCNLKRNKHQGFVWRWDNGDDFVERVKQPKKGKIVYQYDLDFNLKKIFNSLKEASDILNIESSNIAFCCKHHHRKAGGFYWRYKQIEK